jgi:hypothetical protein
MSDWKVKLPDNQSADQLQTSLAKHVDEVCQMKDKWPSDKNEGYRMVAQHIFEALYDTGSATGATGAGAGTGASGANSAGSSSSGAGTSSGSSQK